MPRPSPKAPGNAPSFIQRHERSLVPVGTSTGLPLTAQRVRRLEETLLSSLARWGYQEIIPPTFEYLDVLAAGLEPEVIENCYKFPDRTTGRILLLRPDVTAQVARIVAMGMVGWKFPLRLCYRTTVFRYEPEHAGRDREIFQVGAELVGVDDVVTDGEIIAVMVECLKELGLPAFNISLGHVGFFKGLLARTGMTLEGRKRAEHAAARKDLPRLEEILLAEKVSKKEARAVLEAPGLYGQEEVLERGRVLAGKHRELEAALARLTKVYRLLVKAGMQEHLVLDLGEFRGFDYYDGIAFDVFAQGVGYELGGGGRYNHLIGRFGRAIPSTGFALDVDRLFEALERVEEHIPQPNPEFLVSASDRGVTQLFQVAHLLRRGGFRVIQGKARSHRSHTVPSAVEEGRQLGVSAVVVLGVPNATSDEAVVVGHPLTGLDAGDQGTGEIVEGTRGSRPKRSVPVTPQQLVKIKDLCSWGQTLPDGSRSR